MGLFNSIQNFVTSFFINSIERKAKDDAQREFIQTTPDEARDIYKQFSLKKPFNDVPYDDIVNLLEVGVLTISLKYKST